MTDITKEEARDLERLAARFVEDYEAGVFSEIPLRQASYEDCLVEYGAPHFLGNSKAQRHVGARVNRELTRRADQVMALDDSSLATCLAVAFENAIQTGHLPVKETYTRAQALSFINGALGVSKMAHNEILPQMATAHNVRHDTGVIEEVTASVVLIAANYYAEGEKSSFYMTGADEISAMKDKWAGADVGVEVIWLSDNAAALLVTWPNGSREEFRVTPDNR